jgi:endoglucanase
VLRWGGYPAPFAPQWDQPMVSGFRYMPAVTAQPRVGPAYRLGKCVNMSDMMEAPKEGGWGPAITDKDFEIIRDGGFSTVRLPISWSSHAALQPPYAIDPAFLKRVHHVVDRATAAGLRIMLDMHNFSAIEEDPVSQQERFVAIWTQIAASFADAPDSVWFELLNEPHNKLTNANLAAVYAPALHAIRATNPKRIVVVGPEWNNLDKMIAFDFPDDPNIVPSFHYYDPFPFTHQGARWVIPTPPVGRGFGSAQDKAELDATLAKVKAYMQSSGRLPFVGEYGAQDDARVPLAQRLRYYGTVSAAFASIGVDSCIWGYRTGFRIREGDDWLPGMLETIATTRER